MKRLIPSVLMAVLFAGCGEVRQDPQTPLVPKEHGYVMTIVLDMSGPFHPLMTEGGKAYEFAMQVVDRYFRDRLGTQDVVVIALIAGTDRALVWQGTPRDLRAQFSSARSFSDYLKEKARSGGVLGGSCVYDSITNTVEYVTSDPRVVVGQAKSADFVLSDMLDNASRSPESELRAVTVLTKYAQSGGTVGFYYVDQSLVPTWRKHLQGAGFRHFIVESEIVGRPTLPNIE